MLPAPSRIRSRGEHQLVARAGRRAGCGPLTVHLLLTGRPGGPRAGFVVGRVVGSAVVRNRVRRRLREQVRARLDRLPEGGLLLVRASRDAASATSAEIGALLDAAFAKLLAASPGPAPPARPVRGSGAGRPAGSGGPGAGEAPAGGRGDHGAHGAGASRGTGAPRRLRPAAGTDGPRGDHGMHGTGDRPRPPVGGESARRAGPAEGAGP